MRLEGGNFVEMETLLRQALSQLQAVRDELSAARAEREALRESVGQLNGTLMKTGGEILRMRTEVEQIKADIAREFNAMEALLGESSEPEAAVIERLSLLGESVDALQDDLYILKGMLKARARLRRPEEE